MIPLTVAFESNEVEVLIDKEYKCWDCKDSGELEKYTWDQDHQTSIWDGYRPCHCTL